MTDFIVQADSQIRGAQLIDEIYQATGIDLTDHYIFYPPVTVRVLPDELVSGREAEIQTIIDNHVPDPLYFPEDEQRQREREAEGDAANIPGYASWTEDQAVSWIDENVTDLASAKQALTALTRMVIAMRNKLWPNLEGS